MKQDDLSTLRHVTAHKFFSASKQREQFDFLKNGAHENESRTMKRDHVFGILRERAVFLTSRGLEMAK